jgi:hypothetical protein
MISLASGLLASQARRLNARRFGIQAVVAWIQNRDVRFGSKTYLLNPALKTLKLPDGIEPKIDPVAEAPRRRSAAAITAPPASPDVCLTPPVGRSAKAVVHTVDFARAAKILRRS